MTEDGQESHTPFCHFWFYFFCDYTMRQSAREMSFIDDLSACDPSLKLCADFLWKQSYLFQRFSFNFINALRSFHYCYFFKPRSLSNCWWVSLFIPSPSPLNHHFQWFTSPNLILDLCIIWDLTSMTTGPCSSLRSLAVSISYRLSSL